MALKEYTEEELRAALTRKQSMKGSAPTPARKPDFSQVLAKCMEYANAVNEEELDDGQYPIAIFQLAMEAVFPENAGEDFWEWVRTKRGPAFEERKSQEEQAAKDRVEKIGIQMAAMDSMNEIALKRVKGKNKNEENT